MHLSVEIVVCQLWVAFIPNFTINHIYDSYVIRIRSERQSDRGRLGMSKRVVVEISPSHVQSTDFEPIKFENCKYK